MPLVEKYNTIYCLSRGLKRSIIDNRMQTRRKKSTKKYSDEVVQVHQPPTKIEVKRVMVALGLDKDKSKQCSRQNGNDSMVEIF